MEINWKEAEEFFFEAMLQGWVAGGKPQPIPEFQGFEGFAYKRGNFRLLDMWPSRNDGSGLGTTTIFFDNGGPWVAIWRMQYRGKYPKEVLEFLKTVLKGVYHARIFNAGRGPLLAEQGYNTYINTVEAGSTFAKFRCREEISDNAGGVLLGFHECSGGTLI